MLKRNRLTFFILLAMVLGILVGYLVHERAEPAFIASFQKNIKLLTTIFIRLVQMIIAPLVFTTLVVGIAKEAEIEANREDTAPDVVNVHQDGGACIVRIGVVGDGLRGICGGGET